MKVPPSRYAKGFSYQHPKIERQEGKIPTKPPTPPSPPFQHIDIVTPGLLATPYRAKSLL